MSMHQETEAKYRISVIAEMLSIHPQTIRAYEKLGLVRPMRSKGNTRLFSEKDVRTIRRILSLTQDMGVNLAGVEIILRLRAQIDSLQSDMVDLAEMIQRYVTSGDRAGDKDAEIVVRRCQSLLQCDWSE